LLKLAIQHLALTFTNNKFLSSLSMTFIGIHAENSRTVNNRIQWSWPEYIGTNLIPETTRTYDLGSITNEWDDIYCFNLYSSNAVTITGSLTSASSATGTLKVIGGDVYTTGRVKVSKSNAIAFEGLFGNRTWNITNPAGGDQTTPIRFRTNNAWQFEVDDVAYYKINDLGESSFGKLTTTPVKITKDGELIVQNGTDSSNINTGSIICNGGIGVEKNIYVGGKVSIDLEDGIAIEGTFGTGFWNVTHPLDSDDAVKFKTESGWDYYLGEDIYFSIKNDENDKVKVNIGSTTPVKIDENGILTIQNATIANDTEPNIEAALICEGGIYVENNLIVKTNLKAGSVDADAVDADTVDADTVNADTVTATGEISGNSLNITTEISAGTVVTGSVETESIFSLAEIAITAPILNLTAEDINMESDLITLTSVGLIAINTAGAVEIEAGLGMSIGALGAVLISGGLDVEIVSASNLNFSALQMNVNSVLHINKNNGVCLKSSHQTVLETTTFWTVTNPLHTNITAPIVFNTSYAWEFRVDNTNYFKISDSGQVTIGNTTPISVSTAGILAVTNNAPTCATFAGGISVAGEVTFGSISTTGALAAGNTSITGTCNVSGTLTAGSLSTTGTASVGALTATSAQIGTSTELIVSSAGLLTVANTTASTSPTTGCAVFSGGVGIAGNTYLGNELFISRDNGDCLESAFGARYWKITNPSSASTTNPIAFKTNNAWQFQCDDIAYFTISDVGVITCGSSTALSISAAGRLTVANTTASTTSNEGCAVFSGGIGVAGNCSVGASVLTTSIKRNNTALETLTLSSGSITVDATFGSVIIPCSIQMANAGNGDSVTIGYSTALTVSETGNLTVANTTVSTTTSTGCAVFAGGIGVAGQVTSGSLSAGNSTPVLASTGGLFTVQNTTNATGVNTGSAIFAGGVYIAKNTWISGSVVIVSTGLLTVNNTTDPTSRTDTSASISTQGGLAVAKGIYCFDLYSSNETRLARFAGTTEIGSSTKLIVSATGALTVANTTVSTTTSSGCATFAGGIGVAGQGTFGSISTGGTLTVGSTTITGTCIVSGSLSGGSISTSGTASTGALTATSATIGTSTALTVSTGGLLTVANTTSSTASNNGCAVFSGGIGVAGNCSVGASVLTTSIKRNNTALETLTLSSGSITVDATFGSVIIPCSIQMANAGNGDSVTIGYSTVLTVSDTGRLTVANTTSSSSTTTGCAAFAGGIGVAGQVTSATLRVGTSTALTVSSGGALAVANTTASSSTATGCATFAGGVGIAGKTYMGDILQINSPVDVIYSSMDSTALRIFGEAVDSGHSATVVINSTSAFARNRGASIALGGRMYNYGGGNQHATFARIKGVQRNDNDAYFGHFVIETQNSGTLSERVRIDHNGKTTISGVLDVTDSTASSSTTTGCATFAGGIGVAGKVTSVSASVGSSTALTISSAGVLTVANTTASTSTSTGCVILSGGIGVNGAVNCLGLTTSTTPTRIGTGPISIRLSYSSTITGGNVNPFPIEPGKYYERGNVGPYTDTLDTTSNIISAFESDLVGGVWNNQEYVDICFRNATSNTWTINRGDSNLFFDSGTSISLASGEQTWLRFTRYNSTTVLVSALN
jgi:hypothetical protein